MSITLGEVKELQTAVIQATIENELHDPIDGANLLFLKVTISNQDTAAIINGREHQDIWGVAPARVNGGMINGTGLLDLRLDPIDNPVLDQGNDVENHLVLLEWSWMDSGFQKYGAEELILPVINLSKVGSV